MAPKKPKSHGIVVPPPPLNLGSLRSENAGVDHSQNVLNTKNWMINRDKAQKEKEDSQKEKEKEERENQEKQKGFENQPKENVPTSSWLQKPSWQTTSHNSKGVKPKREFPINDTKPQEVESKEIESKNIEPNFQDIKEEIQAAEEESISGSWADIMEHEVEIEPQSFTSIQPNSQRSLERKNPHPTSSVNRFPRSNPSSNTFHRAFPTPDQHFQNTSHQDPSYRKSFPTNQTMPFQRRPPFRDQYQENRPTNYSRFPKHSPQNYYSDNQKNFGSPSYYDQPFPRRDQQNQEERRSEQKKKREFDPTLYSDYKPEVEIQKEMNQNQQIKSSFNENPNEEDREQSQETTMITPNTKYRPPIHGNNEELHQKQRQILAEKAKSKLLQQSTTIQRKNPPFQSEQENLVGEENENKNVLERETDFNAHKVVDKADNKIELLQKSPKLEQGGIQVVISKEIPQKNGHTFDDSILKRIKILLPKDNSSQLNGGTYERKNERTLITPKSHETVLTMIVKLPSNESIKTNELNFDGTDIQEQERLQDTNQGIKEEEIKEEIKQEKKEEIQEKKDIESHVDGKHFESPHIQWSPPQNMTQYGFQTFSTENKEALHFSEKKNHINISPIQPPRTGQNPLHRNDSSWPAVGMENPQIMFYPYPYPHTYGPFPQFSWPINPGDYQNVNVNVNEVIEYPPYQPFFDSRQRIPPGSSVAIQRPDVPKKIQNRDPSLESENIRNSPDKDLVQNQKHQSQQQFNQHQYQQPSQIQSHFQPVYQQHLHYQQHPHYQQQQQQHYQQMQPGRPVQIQIAKHPQHQTHQNPQKQIQIQNQNQNQNQIQIQMPQTSSQEQLQQSQIKQQQQPQTQQNVQITNPKNETRAESKNKPGNGPKNKKQNPYPDKS